MFLPGSASEQFSGFWHGKSTYAHGQSIRCEHLSRASSAWKWAWISSTVSCQTIIGYASGSGQSLVKRCRLEFDGRASR